MFVLARSLPSGTVRSAGWTAIDVTVALVLAVPAVSHQPPEASLPASVLAVVAALPLAARRYLPVPVFCLVLVASAAATAVGARHDLHLPLALALYPVAAHLHPRWSSLALAVALTATATSIAVAPGDPRTPKIVWFAASAVIISAALAAGGTVYRRLAHDAAERARLIRESVARQRLRVARQLYDLEVETSLVPVGGPGYTPRHDAPPTGPGPATPARRDEPTRQGEPTRLGEPTRQDEPTRHAAPEPPPPPAVTALPGLVAQINDLGVRTELEVRGTVRALLPAIDLTAYTIVEQALINVVEAARPTRCRIRVDYQPAALVIEVTDDAGPADAGLSYPQQRYLREGRARAELYGGELTAGPLPPPRTGFRITVRLPIPAAPTGTGQATA